MCSKCWHPCTDMVRNPCKQEKKVCACINHIIKWNLRWGISKVAILYPLSLGTSPIELKRMYFWVDLHKSLLKVSAIFFYVNQISQNKHKRAEKYWTYMVIYHILCILAAIHTPSNLIFFFYRHNKMTPGQMNPQNVQPFSLALTGYEWMNLFCKLLNIFKVHH